MRSQPRWRNWRFASLTMGREGSGGYCRVCRIAGGEWETASQAAVGSKKKGIGFGPLAEVVCFFFAFRTAHTHTGRLKVGERVGWGRREVYPRAPNATMIFRVAPGNCRMRAQVFGSPPSAALSTKTY